MRRLVLLCAAWIGFAALLNDGAPVRADASRVVAADTMGKRIFETKGNCFACHGMNAKGTPLAPDLTDAEWLNADGTLESILKVVREGVAKPKKHPAPMPPLGGGPLNDAEAEAVARYVDSLTP